MFSAPIVAGVILGLLFPFTSQSLIWISSLLLFLLLFLNTLAVEKKKWIPSRTNWVQCLVTQALVFIYVPVCATALAALVLRDQDFVFGVAVASLAPCALVNPFFANHRGADAGLALLSVLVSTLLCSLITVPWLKWSNLSPVFLDIKFLSLYLGLLTVVPILLSFTVTRLYSPVSKKIQPVLPVANSLILALLMFILVGSSLERVPLRLLASWDFAFLVALFVALDFGTFAATKLAAVQFMSPTAADTMALGVASRNFAVSSSLMLAFHPKAALPSAVGLMIHSVFFQWLLKRKGDKA
jgi:predicted Na+-dependent transporter